MGVGTMNLEDAELVETWLELAFWYSRKKIMRTIFLQSESTYTTLQS